MGPAMKDPDQEFLEFRSEFLQRLFSPESAISGYTRLGPPKAGRPSKEGGRTGRLKFAMAQSPGTPSAREHSPMRESEAGTPHTFHGGKGGDGASLLGRAEAPGQAALPRGPHIGIGCAEDRLEETRRHQHGRKRRQRSAPLRLGGARARML